MLPVAKGVEVTCYYFYFYRTFREKAKTFLKKHSVYPQVASQNNTFFLHFDDLTVDIYINIYVHVCTHPATCTHTCVRGVTERMWHRGWATSSEGPRRAA